MIQRALAPSPASAGGILPRHVALVLAGTPRWARRQGVSTPVAVAAGVRALLRTVTGAAERGIEYLTVWEPGDCGVLSSLGGDTAAIAHTGARVRALGAAAVATVAPLVAATAGNHGIGLNLAVAYDARAELLRAVRRIARDVRDGRRGPAVDDETIASYLDTAGLPDPDLVVRSGGDRRVADFLPYQIAYSELWSTDVDWPAFEAAHFQEALETFATRQRRFGG